MFALINDTGIAVVAIALIVLFGAGQLPKLARSLGEAGRELRNASKESDSPEHGASPMVPVVGLTTGSQPLTASAPLEMGTPGVGASAAERRTA